MTRTCTYHLRHDSWCFNLSAPISCTCTVTISAAKALYKSYRYGARPTSGDSIHSLILMHISIFVALRTNVHSHADPAHARTPRVDAFYIIRSDTGLCVSLPVRDVLQANSGADVSTHVPSRTS